MLHFQTKLLPSTILLITLTVADCLVYHALPSELGTTLAGTTGNWASPLCRTVGVRCFTEPCLGLCCVLLLWFWTDTSLWFVPFGLRSAQQADLHDGGGVALGASCHAAAAAIVAEDLQITTCHDALP